MNKYYAKIENKSETIDRLTDILGIPTIKRKLSVYAYNEKEDEAQINFIDRDCSIGFNIQGMGKSDESIRIRNSNIKYLFKSIYHLGFKQANISEILQLSYKHENTEITLSFDTYIGNVITLKTDDIEKFEKFLGINFVLRSFLATEIATKYEELKLKRRPILNELGILDARIISYASGVGIDIRSVNRSIISRIESFSNDYSIYELLYQEITGKSLLSKEGHTRKSLSCPLSIVIPCYNVSSTLLKTLYSIQVQDIQKEDLQKIEVNLIDDCSKESITKFLKNHKFDFQLNIIKINKNVGVSTARRIGFSKARYDQLLFMDADIILPINYLAEITMRLKTISGAVFVAFKNNIEGESISIQDIQAGLQPPKNFDDLRLYRHVTPGTAGIRQVTHDSHTEVLADSNYFKELGFGRKIGNFDLPSMLIGHNFSLNRKLIKDDSFFSKEFTGWGFDDTYLGAKIISNGNFLIPILSTGVYHIKHPPRSGSEEKKQLELQHNIILYKKLLNEELE